MSVLDEITELARERAKQLAPSDARCERANFADALRGRDRLSIVAEFKRASPSLGDIADRDVASQVRHYRDLGASAISVLTEPSRFRGS
ncbi:MAG: indole-3-glycerol-phosphate synthase TrpC, partial [Planctomycetes bacterium]|nr:indole-3-glycerol-phosphate synthase TrpC [Planctomycetota bacterium]